MGEIRVTTYHLGVETASQPEADRRQRVMVLLNRTDRPTYTKFHCFKCNMPVSELVNRRVVALTDTMDMENLNAGAIGVRCDGRFEGGFCRTWYYFSLGSLGEGK